jgi:deazaflavin-dependent oxidoreductase (nitroreductase family)
MPPQIAYRLGLGPIIGRRVLLLTTKGRKTGLPRVTSLQFEEIDGDFYIGAARGQKADWFRNIVTHPEVKVQVGPRHFRGLAEPVTDPERVADFLQFRLSRHPRMVGAIMRAAGFTGKPDRDELVRYATARAMVIIHPMENNSSAKD